MRIKKYSGLGSDQDNTTFYFKYQNDYPSQLLFGNGNATMSSSLFIRSELYYTKYVQSTYLYIENIVQSNQSYLGSGKLFKIIIQNITDVASLMLICNSNKIV